VNNKKLKQYIQENILSTPLSEYEKIPAYMIGRKSRKSRKFIMKSFIESFIDVGSGFILAILIQLYIFPFFGLYPTIMDSIGIALIFTGVSITRSWLWRMVFKKYE
jgi:hypothetical protein